MLNLVVFASGRGSNFLSIYENCVNGSINAVVNLVISNNKNAEVLNHAKRLGINYKSISPNDYKSNEAYHDALKKEVLGHCCDLIVLAGYMKILSKDFIDDIGIPIINIHPSLLPSFPGLHAQRQAVDYGVKVSGCTVHFVDAGLDSGPIILQASVPVYHDDDDESLSSRILKVEHKIYSEAIELIAQKKCVYCNGRVYFKT